MNTEQSKIVSRVIELHRQRREPVTNRFCGHEFTTFPGVYSPFIAPSGKLTFFFSSQPDFEGKRVLDVGCGSGIIACMSVLSGAKAAVGIDINPAAVDNARYNARRLGVEAKTDFRVGDTFDPLKAGEEFDIIFANLPFALGTPRDSLEAAFFDPELRSIRHYIEDLPRWQTKECRAYLCVSDLDDADLLNVAQSRGLIWRQYVTINEGWINLSIIELNCYAADASRPPHA